METKPAIRITRNLTRYKVEKRNAILHFEDYFALESYLKGRST